MPKLTYILLLAVISPVFGLAADNSPCWVEDAASAGQNVFLLCQQGAVMLSSDQGRSWKAEDLPAHVDLNAIAFVNERQGFIVGNDGTLLATTDAGATWRQVALPVKSHLLNLHFVGRQGWICGWDGVILHTSDGGLTWRQQLTGTLQSFVSIYFTDASHGWAIGWGDTIMRTTDGGRTWINVRAPAARWWISSVYFRDNRNGWIVGMFGLILRTHDGGLTWEAVKSPTNSWLTNVTFDRSGKGWITAQDDILVSEDGGETWNSTGRKEQLFLDCFVHVQGNVWAVGPFAILKHDTTENAWEKLEAPSAARVG